MLCSYISDTSLDLQAPSYFSKDCAPVQATGSSPFPDFPALPPSTYVRSLCRSRRQKGNWPRDSRRTTEALSSVSIHLPAWAVCARAGETEMRRGTLPWIFRRSGKFEPKPDFLLQGSERKVEGENILQATPGLNTRQKGKQAHSVFGRTYPWVLDQLASDFQVTLSAHSTLV